VRVVLVLQPFLDGVRVVLVLQPFPDGVRVVIDVLLQTFFLFF
jgi:hypothetical protein